MAAINVQDFGLNFHNFVEIKSRGEHFLERSTAMTVFITYCLQLMLRRQHCLDILIDAKRSNPTYNILNMLPPQKGNQAY